MSAFVIPEDELKIYAAAGALSTYEFGQCIAKHHFCNRCGIYPFHQTLRKSGHYRFNLGCLEGVEATDIPFVVFDGASI